MLPISIPLRLLLLIALFSGGLQTLSFAPLGCWWLQPFTMAALFFCAVKSPRSRDAAWVGFAFGLGNFLSGIAWLYISLHTYGEMPAGLAALGVFLASVAR